MKPEAQLERLLAEDPSLLREAQRVSFERLTAQSGERFVLFGAGRLGQIARAGLRKVGVEPLAFADNNPKLWNTIVDGVQVLSPKSCQEQFGKDALFIVTVYTSAPVWEQLIGMGLSVASFAALAWQYPQALAPHGGVEPPGKVMAHADEVRKALTLWADDISGAEYVGQLLWQASLDPSVLPSHLPQNEIYFADDLIIPLAKEVFVDCGAFDGDSVQEFIRRRAGSFERIIAIEPDPANCAALRDWLASLPAGARAKIRVEQCAVGSRRDVVTFNATGTAGSSVGKGIYQVQCTTLDELLRDVKPTFFKMDIEGAEPDALWGARKTIQESRPALAVCLYHAQQHLWQIPLLIDSLADQYQFFLRRYADECWETVCYAVPRNRSVV